MKRSRLRLLGLIATIPLLIVISAWTYQLGMATLEGEERSFLEAVQWSAETITTTGYGAPEDNRWNHPLMVFFVISLQVVSVLLVFLIVPIVLIPFLEERFETRLPRRATELDHHVVVYRWGPAVESLVEQLRAAGVPCLVVEESEAVARELFESGRRVILASHEREGLAASGLLRARALIANGEDTENAGIILGARQLGFEGEIIALVEEPVHRKPMTLAGANAVYTPRHVLGAALAASASSLISPRVSGIQQIGRKLELRELRIHEGSPLAGLSLAEADLGARTGATVIGQWSGGRLATGLTAETQIRPRAILVALGTEEGLDELGRLTEGPSLRQEGSFLIAGFGEVGQKVHQLLTDAGEKVVVIDMEERPGVDVVGDVMNPQVLRDAGVESARAVILALSSDDATLFAAVMVQDCAPRAPIIARVNRALNLEKIHRAGADFALSIAQVSGQILARRLLGEESVSLDPQLRVLRIDEKALLGRSLGELQIRQRTGCSVAAVERGEEVLIRFGPDFRFREGDGVYVCGSQEAVRRLGDLFD